MTDEFLVSQMDTSIFDEDFVAQIEAGPTPLADEMQTGVLGVKGVDGVVIDLFIFQDVEGTWLLDDVIENLESQKTVTRSLVTWRERRRRNLRPRPRNRDMPTRPGQHVLFVGVNHPLSGCDAMIIA